MWGLYYSCNASKCFILQLLKTLYLFIEIKKNTKMVSSLQFQFLICVQSAHCMMLTWAGLKHWTLHGKVRNMSGQSDKLKHFTWKHHINTISVIATININLTNPCNFYANLTNHQRLSPIIALCLNLTKASPQRALSLHNAGFCFSTLGLFCLFWRTLPGFIWTTCWLSCWSRSKPWTSLVSVCRFGLLLLHEGKRSSKVKYRTVWVWTV